MSNTEGKEWVNASLRPNIHRLYKTIIELVRVTHLEGTKIIPYSHIICLAFPVLFHFYTSKLASYFTTTPFIVVSQLKKKSGNENARQKQYVRRVLKLKLSSSLRVV